VLETAVRVADEGGIEALTMRNLAEALEVEAMSIYYHVPNKEAVLDGVTEVVVREMLDATPAIADPEDEEGWKRAMRAKILASRQVLLRHPWAPAVMETRKALSVAVLEYYDGVLGLFRAGGFSYDLAHHALHALGSRAMGYAPDSFEPDTDDPGHDDPMVLLGAMKERFPHLVEMLQNVSHDAPGATLGWCDDQTEFEFGLDLMLDGLDRLRRSG
jgi:AcrR family transcriptional regulator